MSELEYRAGQPASLWQNNPVLVQLLGLSPVLAVSTTIVNGVGLGAATLIVIILSCLTVSVAKSYINATWRFFWYLVILATYTTIVDMLMQWLYLPLYRELGIYIPLIACNIAILVRMETSAYVSPWNLAASDAAKTGAGFLLAILLLALVREFIATGSILNDLQLLIPSPLLEGNASALAVTGELFTFAKMQPAALILLGLIIGIKNFIDSRFINSDEGEMEDVKSVKRVRVTGE